MVHADFDITTTPKPFFTPKGWQHGKGLVDTSHFFSGMPFQRGYGAVGLQSGRGISNVLMSAWRFLAPVLKSLGKNMGTEALATGGRILSALSSDRSDVKGTLKTQLKSGGKNILRKTGEELLQRGSGRQKRRTPALTGVHKKRTKKDILGFY